MPDPAKPDPAVPSDADRAGEGPSDVAGLLEVAGKATKTHLVARGFIGGIVVAAAMVAFVLQNTETIALNWLWFDFDAGVWMVLLGAFVAGMITAPLLLAGWRRAARQRAERKRVVAGFERSRRDSEPSTPSQSHP